MDAPRGSVEFAESDELRRLRRRAYGPDADIAADAAAQVRLYELEAAHRRQLTPVVDAAFAERVPAGGSVAELDLAAGSIVDSDPIAGAPTAPWWRRRRFLILGGTIGALALTVTVVAWMAQLLSDGFTPIPTETSTAKMLPLPAGQGYVSSVPAPDAVLGVRSVGVDADRPNDRRGTLDALGISTDALRRYEDFQGLNVWSGESRYGPTCLLVAVPGQGLREGLSGEGCSSGLHPSADLPSMRGDGLIRFVLGGDHVSVYVYESGADAHASRG